MLLSLSTTSLEERKRCFWRINEKYALSSLVFSIYDQPEGNQILWFFYYKFKTPWPNGIPEFGLKCYWKIIHLIINLIINLLIHLLINLIIEFLLVCKTPAPRLWAGNSGSAQEMDALKSLEDAKSTQILPLRELTSVQPTSVNHSTLLPPPS